MSREDRQLALNGSAASQRAIVTPRKSHCSRARTRIGRWRATFLKTLRKVPNITLACEAANVSRRTCYDHRAADPKFAEAWDDALNQSVDRVETRCFELASGGEPRLIEFILKAHRPERYRETSRHEVGLLGRIVLLPAKEKGAE